MANIIGKGKEKHSIEQAVHILLNETRLVIANSLLERPKYISDLARSLGLDRSTVSYHLNILECLGIIEAQYILLEEPQVKGKMGKVYSVNRIVLRETLEVLGHRLPRLEL